MPFRIVDHKKVDMTDEEHAYYRKLVNAFEDGPSSFRDLFDVDADGCISFIRPPVGRQVPWAVIIFLQNLMINQHERRRDAILEQRLAEIERRLSE